jgi:hypothetical protein
MIAESRLRRMADELADVTGVVGVVLGGSRARRTHLEQSDVDLGIYYTDRLDLRDLSVLAEKWHGAPLKIAAPGKWGHWVDGGAWLTVDDTHVDWILRNFSHVTVQWERARSGRYAFHNQAGHPLGFLDVSYAGELAVAKILSDPSGALGRLKANVKQYPPALRRAFIKGLWEADFLLDAAEKGVEREDTVYVSLCLSRALLLCAHAVHAANGRWVINEKGLLADAGDLDGAPARFVERSGGIVARIGRGPRRLGESIDQARAIVAETRTNVKAMAKDLDDLEAELDAGYDPELDTNVGD